MSSAALRRVKAFLDECVRRPRYREQIFGLNDELLTVSDLAEVVAAAERCAELERALAGAVSLVETVDWTAFSLADRAKLDAARAALSPKRATSGAAKHPTTCQAASDGECIHDACPQLRDGEPEKTGRTCPLPWPQGENDDAPLPKRAATKRGRKRPTHDAGCVCRACRKATQLAAKESGF